MLTAAHRSTFGKSVHDDGQAPWQTRLTVEHFQHSEYGWSGRHLCDHSKLDSNPSSPSSSDNAANNRPHTLSPSFRYAELNRCGYRYRVGLSFILHPNKMLRGNTPLIYFRAGRGGGFKPRSTLAF